LEKLIPRKFTEENFSGITYNQRFSQGKNHLNSLTKALSEPIYDLLDRGGKRWRPILGMLVA
jgi:geranylgeranyl pyrophosphate synthase